MEVTTKTYNKYKPSGVEWLGKIPEHWEVKRLGSYFSERRTKVSDKDFKPLSVTKNGVVPQLSNAAKSNDGDNRKLVKKGDFVINSRSDRKGSSGIAKEDGSVSLINIVMKPIQVDELFCNYLLKSTAFVEENYRIGHGIVADLWTTRYDEMKNIKIGFPPLKEQTAIANFLDDKTSKIDQAIAQKQQLIALLKERKQIVIQNAVTGQLKMDNGQWIMRPKSEMKDSGVEWIGDIPEHWDIYPIRRLFDVRDGTHDTPQYIDPNRSDAVPLVTSKDFTEKGLIDFSTSKMISRKNHMEISKRSKVDKNDVLMSMIGGNIGKSVIAKGEEYSIKNVALFKKEGDLIESQFLIYYIISGFLEKQIKLISRGGAQSFLSLGDLRNLTYFDINRKEKEQIISYLNDKIQKINKAITIQEEQIAKLQEYKASLIDSVVTGKVKVC